MTAPPPRDPADLLDLLAMAHYAVAALWAMVSLVPMLWVLVGFELAGASGLHRAGEPAPLPPTPLAVVVGLGLLLGGFVGGALTVWGGRCLATRRRPRVALLATLVVCLFVPIGTALGAYTWSLLQRPEVRARFTG